MAGVGAAQTLAGLTWPEVAKRAAGSVIAVPLGSTEQHGPHLPLSTDSDIAVELCRRLAAQRHDVLEAPAVAYGSSGEHAGFPGTLSIGATALETVLVELGRSADAFAGVLFVSAHGGNAGSVQRATRLLVSESRNARAWFLPELDLADGLPADRPADFSVAGRWDAHAGYVETSVMEQLKPGAVRHDLAAAGTITPLTELMPAMRQGGLKAVSANGVLGDPSGASAVVGAAILDSWAAHLVADLQGWPG